MAPQRPLESAENPTLRPGASGDDAMAHFVQQHNQPGARVDQSSGDLRALNTSLQQSGKLPGLDIVGMQASTNPADHTESVTMTPTDKNQHLSNSTYNPDTHQLQYTREPAQLPGNRGAETVEVNMLTGQETVSAMGDNNTIRTTTRAGVGDTACTTVVTDNPPAGQQARVLQTEGIDGNAQLTTRQFQYDSTGKLTGFTQDGKTTNVPADATNAHVDPKTGDMDYSRKDGVQVQMHPDGTSTMQLPADANGQPGRTFTVDKNGTTSYNVQPGDTMWDVSRDLAKLQGNLNPSDSDIQGIVNQIGHAGDNHNANTIQAGETIAFGVGTKAGGDQSAQNDNVDLRAQVAAPQDAPVIVPGKCNGDGKPDSPATWQPPGKNPITLPGDMNNPPAGSPPAHLDSTGHLVYTNNDGNTVNVNPDNGQEVTTYKNGTQATRDHAGGNITDYHSADGQGPQCENGNWTGIPGTDKDHPAKDVQLDANGNLKSYDQDRNGTTVTYDKDGTPTAYGVHNGQGDYTLSKHDDGKWYYNKAGSNTYVQVDGGTINMDNNSGTVSFREAGYGWFGAHHTMDSRATTSNGIHGD